VQLASRAIQPAVVIRRGLVVAALVGLLSIIPESLAGPPFVTDDPEPVDFRHWEIFLASVPSHDSAGWSGALPQLEINYGAVPNLQLSLTIPISFSAARNGTTQSGFGDVLFGTKYRFISETENRPQIAFYPQVTAPTGDAQRGLGSGHADLFLPIFIQKGFGKWTAYGGGGYWINPGTENKNWLFTGAVLQRQVSNNLSLGLEVFHETAKSRQDTANTTINAGIIWDLSETYHLVASAGHSIQGPSTLIGYAGIQFKFGPSSERPSNGLRGTTK